MKTALQETQLSLSAGRVACIKWRGNGPLVLYVHGWAHSSRAWSQLARPSINSHAHTEVFLDLPGFGVARDVLPGSPKVDFYATFIRDLCPALVERFGAPIDVIIAHSLGGLAVARAFSPTMSSTVHPDKIVLLDVPFRGVHALKVLVVLYPLLYAGFTLIKHLPKRLAHFFVRVFALPTTYKWSAMSEEFVADCLAAKPSVLFSSLFAVAFASIHPSEKPNARTGIWLARGKWDWIMTSKILRRYSRCWCAFPKTFDKSSHTPHLEEPETVDRWLASLLSSPSISAEVTSAQH